MKEGTPSRTSLNIARIGVYYGRHPDFRDICPPGLADTNQRLLDAVGLLPRSAHTVYDSPAFDRLLAATDRHLAPGANTHFPLRKRFVEDQVLAAGVPQLLVVGAGLDSLAVRVAHATEMRCVEIDHPATGAVKARAIAASGLSHPRLEAVQADLSVVPLDQALAASSWDPTVPGVAVAEGLLMYLPDAAVRGLFDALHARMAPGSRFVFSWLVMGPDGQPRMTGWIRRLIALGGEPIRWSIQPQALAEYVRARGWRLLPEVDLRETYLAGTSLAEAGMTDWERLAVVERV